MDTPSQTGKISTIKRPADVEKTIKMRRYRRRAILISIFLLFVTVIGFIVGGVLVLSPNIQTQTAIPASMTDSVVTQGVVVLSAVEVSAPGAGYLYFTVNAGQRVSGGAAVADVYASSQAAEARVALERINAEIAQLQAAQNTFVESGDVEGLLHHRQEEAYNLLNAIDTGDYGNIEMPLAAITLASNKLQVATGVSVDFTTRMDWLLEQKYNYERMAVAQNTITTPASGYFVPAQKYDEVIAKYDDLAQATIEGVMGIMQAPRQYYPKDVVGHIVSDYKWHCFVVLPLADTARFKTCEKLQVAFPDYSDAPLPVKVIKIEEDMVAQVAKIELLCEYINPLILGLRQEKTQLIFSVQQGIRIDKKALRIKDGEYGVYIKVGNLVRYRKIKILLEDENYVLISDEYEKGSNEIALYDEIVVDNGGLELYDQRIL